MAVIKYNDTELDYNDIEKAVINGIDNFFNSNSFYGTPRSNGTYKRKYEDLRLQDRQAIMKVLGDMRNNDNVVVTASGITWNNGLDGLINDPSHRRAAGYIAKTLMNMPGKPKPEKKKLSRDILNKELVSLIGDVSSLSKEYRTKAYNDAISYILSKYTNLDDYDIAEGFDWNDYSNRLSQALRALGTDDIEDDKYWLHNRLGIPITEDKIKVASNYDANTNNFILGLTAFGLSRQEAELYYNTQVRQALIQKYVEDFMNKNKVSSTPTAPSTNAGVSASSSQTRITPKVSPKKTPTDTEPETPPSNAYNKLKSGDLYNYNGKQYSYAGKGLGKDPERSTKKRGAINISKNGSKLNYIRNIRKAEEGDKATYEKIGDVGTGIKDSSRGILTALGPLSIVASIAARNPALSGISRALGRWATPGAALGSGIGSGLESIGDAMSPSGTWSDYVNALLKTGIGTAEAALFRTPKRAAVAKKSLAAINEAKQNKTNAQSELDNFSTTPEGARYKNATDELTKWENVVNDANTKRLYEEAKAIPEASRSAVQKTRIKIYEQALANLNNARNNADLNLRQPKETALNEATTKLTEAENAAKYYYPGISGKNALGIVGLEGLNLGAQGLLGFEPDDGSVAPVLSAIGGSYRPWEGGIGTGFKDTYFKLFPKAGPAVAAAVVPAVASAKSDMDVAIDRYYQNQLHSKPTMGGLLNKKAGDFVNTAEGPTLLKEFRVNDRNLEAIGENGEVLTQILPEVTVNGTKPSWMPQFEINPNYNPGEIKPANTSFWYTNPVSRYIREGVGQITNNLPLNGKFVWPYIVPIAAGTSALASGLSSIGLAIAGTAAGTKGLQLLKSLRDANWVATPSNLQTTTSSYAGLTPQDAIINQIKQKGNK